MSPHHNSTMDLQGMRQIWKVPAEFLRRSKKNEDMPLPSKLLVLRFRPFNFIASRWIWVCGFGALSFPPTTPDLSLSSCLLCMCCLVLSRYPFLFEFFIASTALHVSSSSTGFSLPLIPTIYLVHSPPCSCFSI